MPPKKKKSGKKGKKSGGGKSGRSSPSKSFGDMGGEKVNREFYQIQIKDLEYRLSRYQQKCDEMQIEMSDIKDRYDHVIAERNDIVEFWKQKADTTEEENKDLEERLTGLQQTIDEETERYEESKIKWRNQMDEMRVRLNEEIQALQKKINTYDNVEDEDTDEAVEKLATLQKLYDEQTEKHAKIIYDIEKKAVIDKDRLKKEMIGRVNNVAAEFRKVSNKQMDETTKRAIRENASIMSQLQHKSEKIVELLQENREISSKSRAQRQDIEIHEAMVKDLTVKNNSREKIIISLTKKCKEQAIEIESLRKLTTTEEIQKAYHNKFEECEMQGMMLQRLEKENEQYESDLEELRTQLRREKRNKEKLDKVISNTAASIRLALKRSNIDEDLTNDIDDHNDLERRNNILENLLLVLNSAAELGVGPDPADMGKTRKSVVQIQKGVDKRSIDISPLPKGPPGVLPHYQLGDLGLIPREKQKIPTSFERMRVLSATTRLGGLRKVLTKSVAVQTVSAPKAMFYADTLLSKASTQTKDAVLKGMSAEHQGQMPNRGPRFATSPTKRLAGKAF